MRNGGSNERSRSRAVVRAEGVRFGKFFIISVSGFALDTALLNALVLGAGLDTELRPVGAKAVSATAAGLMNFVLHRYWTFRDRKGSFFRGLGRYALVRSSAIGLGVFLFGVFNYGFEKLLSQHVRAGLAVASAANLAQIATSMIVLVYSYAMHRRFTFDEASDAEPTLTGGPGDQRARR